MSRSIAALLAAVLALGVGSHAQAQYRTGAGCLKVTKIKKKDSTRDSGRMILLLKLQPTLYDLFAQVAGATVQAATSASASACGEASEPGRCCWDISDCPVLCGARAICQGCICASQCADCQCEGKCKDCKDCCCKDKQERSVRCDQGKCMGYPGPGCTLPTCISVSPCMPPCMQAMPQIYPCPQTATCPCPAPAPMTYRVAVKFCETTQCQGDKVVAWPRMMVAAGRKCRVVVAGSRDFCEGEETCERIISRTGDEAEVSVMPTGKPGVVSLEMCLHRDKKIHKSKTGEVVYSKAMRTVREVKLGKPVTWKFKKVVDGKVYCQTCQVLVEEAGLDCPLCPYYTLPGCR
jgi:hypothetical protein